MPAQASVFQTCSETPKTGFHVKQLSVKSALFFSVDWLRKRNLNCVIRELTLFLFEMTIKKTV